MSVIIELISQFKERIQFSELRSTHEQFTEAQWIEITKAVLRYKNLLQELTQLSPQDVQLIGIVNGELNRDKEPSKIKPNAETFLRSIGNKHRANIVTKLIEFLDPMNPIFQRSLEELHRMMQNGLGQRYFS